MNGIIITTRNRSHVLEYSLKRFAEFCKYDQIIVVDDGSDHWKRNRELCLQYGVVYIRNVKRKGIPYSKEKGFKCALNCDYQFWFDDDCFPKAHGWQDAFIKAMEIQGHLLYLKEWAHIRKVRHVEPNIIVYSGAAACLMTFRKDMYQDVFGICANPKMYGNRWHPDLSEKLQVYGVAPFCSIEGAEYLLHSFDLDRPPVDFDYSFQSSVDPNERLKQK